VISITFLVIIFLTGCSPQKVSSVDLNADMEESKFKIINFLKNHQTTREEIFQRLGEPKCLYESSRIITYCLNEWGDGTLFIHRGACEDMWAACQWDLVLIFDNDSYLKKHSLVKKR
jgi:hypothetical protein